MKRLFLLLALLITAVSAGPLTAQGPGGMQMSERKLVDQFDKNGDQRAAGTRRPRWADARRLRGTRHGTGHARNQGQPRRCETGDHAVL